MSFRLNLTAPRIAQGCILLASLLSAPVSATVKYVAPSADAQVSSGAAASTNFGAETDFCLQSSNGSAICSGTTMGNSRVWLRFNLEGQIPAGATITSARLRINQFETDSQFDDLVIEARGGSDSWSESTINWNTQPALGATAYGPVTVAGSDEYRWYEVDVTGLVSTEWAGDKVVSLVVKPVTESDNQWRTHRFNSREYSNNGAPRLLIEYTGAWSAQNGVDVIHFNDIHARILPHDYDVPEGASDTPELESIGGAAYLATKVLELANAKPDALVLGAGDYSEGSPIGDIEGNRGVIDFYNLLDTKLKAIPGRAGRGVDGEVVGNHDVRYRDMVDSVKASPIPFLSVNVLCGPKSYNGTDPVGNTCPDPVAAAAGDPVPYFTPYTVVTVDGKRIGLIGNTTDDSTYLGTPDVVCPLDPLTSLPPADCDQTTHTLLEVAEVRWQPSSADNEPGKTYVYLQDWVELLRRPQAQGGEGVDMVFLLSHIGHRRLNASVNQNVAGTNYRQGPVLGDNGTVKPPELVVSGHWHTTTESAWQPSNLNYETTNVEAASFAQYVGEVQLSAEGRYISATKHPIRTSEITPDTDVEALLTSLRAEYDALPGECVLDAPGPTNNHPCDVDRVVGHSAVDLRLDKDKWFTHSEFPWSGDNTAGEWVADAMAWKANAVGVLPTVGRAGTLAIQAGGGIRRDVKAGPVTYGDIYEVYPWQDDGMVLVELTGQDICDYVEARYVGASLSEGWQVTADDGEVNCATGITYFGVPLNLAGTYNVLVSDYMYRNDDWISESGFDNTFQSVDPTPTPVQVSGEPVRIRDSVVEYTAQFDASNPMTVAGPRYVLNTEFAGTFRAVVTMTADAENEPYFEAVFVRLLDALPDTIARRTGYGLADIVEPNGSINPQTQWRETMLYRSHLGFPDGVLKVGDIITIKGEGGFFSGNPQFVDQEGIYADATEFEFHGSDPSLALPEYHASFDTFWDEFHENHLVKVRVTRTGESQVTDASGNTYSLFKEGGFYSVVKLPGSNGDTLEITGVQTQRGDERRFRLREATLVTGSDFPPVSAVGALVPNTRTASPITLTATAADTNGASIGGGKVCTGAYVAGTSFEEPPYQSGSYVDSNTSAHTLVNNAGQQIVQYTSTGGELGFSTAFAPATGASGGLSDGDFIGVTRYTVDVGSYTDGLQGFQMQDPDGLLTTSLDAVGLSGLTTAAVCVDVFVVDTAWETSNPFDRIRVWVEGGAAPIDLLNTTGSDVDSILVDGEPLEGRWVTFAADVSGIPSATLKFELLSNAADEEIFVDNIRFTDGVVQTQVTSTNPGTVAQVDFYARQSADGGSTWGAWTLVGSDNAGPAWEYAYTPPAFGLYEFYSIATDSTGSVEPAPVYADAALTFTSLPPDAPFNPSIADGATDVSGVSSIGISVSDPDSATVDVCFYQAGSPATLIGCVTGVPSGSVASVAWAGLADGTTYSWYAIATDAAGVQTQSATFSFTTAAAPAAVNVPALHWLAQLALLLFVAGLGARYMRIAAERR